jgi:hypothetical protein
MFSTDTPPSGASDLAGGIEMILDILQILITEGEFE